MSDTNDIFEADDLDALDALLDAEGLDNDAGAFAIPRRGAAVASLSPAQRRLWFLHELEPESPAYSIVGAAVLRGPLDVDAFEAALADVVGRHEALRTTFESEAGEPRQIVRDGARVELARVVGGAACGAAAETALVARELARRPWDLANGPLVRAALVELGPHTHGLALALHHIIADGRSLGLLLREIAERTDARAAGIAVPPVEPALQLADVAAWQLERLDSGALASGVAFWRDTLADAPALALPTDRPRVSLAARTGATHRFAIDAATAAAVGAAARREGTTPFAALLACFEAVLARWSGQHDFVVGVPVAERTEATADVVGLLANTVGVRADIAGDPTLGELVRRAGAASRAALAHADVPFDVVVEAVGARRDAAGTPLFRAMFSHENASAADLALAGLDVERVDVEDGSAKLDLTLFVANGTDGRLDCSLEVDAGLFEPATAARVAERFVRVVRALADGGDRRVSDLDLVTDGDSADAVAASRAEGEHAVDATVHSLFEAHVARTPDVVAVEAGADRLTYAELDRRANRVARALAARGVGLESRVGLMFARTTDLVAALFGILKAGACYVPLDAANPLDRLSQIAADAEVTLVVASGDRASDAEALGASVLDLDAERAAIDALPSDPIDSGASARSLAYVLFTSGSTGGPKGVMATHGGVATYLTWAARAYGAAAGAGAPVHTPLGFDLTVTSLLAPLAAGGRVLLAEEGEGVGALEALAVAPGDLGVVKLTPAHLDLLAEAVGRARAAAVARRFVVGGSALRGSSVAFWREHAPATRIVNEYGPTETVVGCVAHEVTAEDALDGDVSIGRPIADARAYVLDARLRPVPVGEAGDLYVGGAGVARGYVGRPDLTAAAFLPDPFAPEPGARMYRTGDRARLGADGRFAYLGRADDQAKVRGHRVEPGEVEAALRRHPEVREAAVLALPDPASGARLVAFVVGEGAVAPAELRAHVRDLLPEPMVPSGFVALDALPLTPNGKVDRAALVALDASRAAAPDADAYVAPATVIEEVIVAVWAEVLGVERVGVTDSFFDVGGHSLVATRVVARLNRALSVELPLRALFDAPTVRGLAARVEVERRVAPVTPIVRAPEAERRRLSFAQQRLWFLDRLEPESAAYNIANAVRIEGALDVDALRRALGEIERRHEPLRTRFVDADGEPFHVVDEPCGIALDVEAVASVEDAERRVASLAREPFDLARGPVVRARLLRLGPEDHVLALVIHHVAADGWSMGVVVRELAALVRGESLPALAVDYADWAAWQRVRLAGGEAERQLDYWRAALDGLEPLDLASDRPRPARSTYAGASFDVALDADLVARVARVARAEGATLHMALLAAFSAVLGRWSGRDDVGVGTPVANRTREETEALVGLFVNTLVVRARLDGPRLTFRELVGRVRDAALGAYANQDVPFERVVDAVRPGRDLSRTPLFETMLVLQNAPTGDLTLGTARLSTFDAPTATSTFDVTLSLAPDGDALTGFVEYSTELFDASTVRRLWSHVVALLEAAASDPGVDVRRARLLDDAERECALDAWSGRRDVVADGEPIHERFARVAAAAPDAVAVSLDGRRATYGEVDARSERLAARLAALGVGLESRVGVCVERSPELFVAMLAVLRTGGAFVPLDPDHPAERVRASLDDAGASVVLTTAAHAKLVAGDGRVVVAIGDLDEPRDVAPFVAPSVPAAALAYVVYTSGTTGRPKGVAVSHGAIASAYAAWERLYDLGTIRQHLQMAGAAFDVCVGDFVRALCSGGALVVCPRARLLDPAALVALARRERVELAEFVPAVARVVAEHARATGERIDSLRIAVIGSDVWTAEEIDAFGAAFGSETRLANGYGLTEAAVDSTCWFVGDGEPAAGAPPIGRPLSHAVVYVLDDALEPAPPGVEGDLYVAGPGLARGYLGRPDATASSFVPDPFGPPGSRAYRTGDRARMLADGRLAFAGRADDQVKIRGVRVEPAEVEGALAAVASVAACAVVARDGEDGRPRLVAYVVPHEGDAFDADVARRDLRARLPEAMVPSAFVVLDALPLTQNGKVDRRRLPEPERDEQATAEPPRPGAETAVAEAFADVLGLVHVGATDDFFALGGHSLLATRVVSRVRATLGVEVPLRTIFEAPTVRELAARIEPLAATDAPPALGRANDDERSELSFAQRRLWFLDRLEPESAAYNLPSSVLLRGELDRAALARAIDEVVRRHEALRTRYVEGVDGPEQIVDPAASVDLATTDLSALPEEQRRAKTERLIREEARRPFDLARGPVLRARLLRLAADEHLLLVTIHHVSADGWSLGVLVSELGALYGAFARGEASPLPEPAAQYADWAAWQRRWLAGGESERQLAFWRDELAGAETLALPTDRPRPGRPRRAGSARAVRFDARLTRRLEAFARREGATLHMVLLAGYAASLGRWSGQTDFAVGTPVANRRSAEAESLVGFFVNTLPVRARLGGRGLTFRGLVGRVREASLGAYANQDVPFERVVEALDPDRAFGHTPVVQTLFALQNAPVGEIALPGLTLVYDEPETGTTRFDVELFLAETPGGLEGNVNFDTELFERETVGRFVENLMALFEAAVDDPDRALGEVAGLAPAQARRVLVDWNARRVDYGDQLAVHALVEAWADRTPDAVAARLGDETIAYAELDRRANRLARYVRRAGGTDGALVAVCVERSIDVLVALLATMKAGAAYVPVDPEYPSERIALVLDDADAAVVLTRSSVAARLPETRARIVRLDADRAEIDLEDDERLDVAVSPEALVYSAYTSGSTGKPKGVAMTHRAISNLLSFQRRDSATHGALRTLQFASLSFDVSFQEIFSTLTAGGEVVLVGDAERRDVSRLVEIVDERGVERVFVPFVALDQFAEAAVAEGRLPRALREIDTAGEQLKITPSIRAFFTAAPECRLVNHYGPSETHLVTTHALEGDPATWPELPPIGSPIANAPVYVLDADLRPVAAGVPGELYVGGAGLARGYHARPDLTAEAFVPDPFADEAGARMYRTGDLARFRSDGVLEFLGRRDLQVKVRGYRVEPGEIESALARHPAVRAVAVAARDGRTGKRLAAYVVFEEGASATVETLRAFCATTLPEFMVPSAFVALDALPVSPNGKVDRGALPEPEWAATTASVAPRTPAEEVVCGAFAEALGLDRVGATDDFFELGGHSLLATSVISRVRRAFGVEVPLRALFESPTPAGVAAAALAARGVAPLPPVERASDEDRRALSYAQRRLWFLDRLEPGLAVYNVPAAIRLDGALDVVALERALAELVRRHESLRTRFVEGPDGPEQLVDPATSFLVECDDVSGGADPESEAERIVAGEATRPFDLARGPVLRTRLIRIGDESHVLSLVVHHISADGWSVGILVRELGALYLAYVEGRESTLAEPALQYGDWAAWQRAWIEGGELDRQLAYWRSELEDAPAALDVPTDRARSATATWRGSTFDVELPSDLGGRLARLARAEGATLHMVLLAAYAWTLMRHAGARDVVVGVPVANRRAVEAEALVGFFVNTLAVRVRGNGDRLTFRDLLARVREASLRAYANQDVPFERVVEAARPERALNRAPLFQTAFALQNARVPELELPGLRVRAVDTETETSKFDLMLTLEEREAGLGGAVEYNTDLFDRETISDVVTHFASVLAAVAAEPGRPLDEIPLDAVGAKRAFAAWSVGSATLESSALVHERFESVAARTPDALALARGDETRTYAEVEASANRLAHHLRALGVGAESRVAIALDRGPDAVVALLAVLKAGGAYVPLEPGQPAERLRALVEDCAAKVVITESRHGAAFDGASARVVAIDRVADEIASRPASRLEPFARPGSLAYVIFTSGSTGRPKGVGVEHRSLAAYTSAAIRRLEIEPGWRFLVVSTLAADLGNTSIFPALTTGGCLDLLPPDLAFDPTGVETYAAARPYDALKIVPSHLAALLGGARPEHVLPRNLLVLGGEATTGATLDALARLAPACRVAIHYGPTETTVGAIAGVVGPGDVARSTGPLGRPLAGTRVYVLDDRLEPVPPGVPGAIHVGGAGVARGYVGAAAATASAFLPDPFADEPGARMYRTGDRARWLRDGRVEFLGRADAQLKIRGYRVEPGEVEVAILSHPDVRAAVAVARKDAAGGVRLAAYVVADPRLAPSLGGLARRHVANGLAFAELNRNETDYIAREIFELGAYVRNGVTLRDGDTIVDVGANAGLFTAFASLACRPARVLAVEPNPRLARVLRANVAAYAPNAEIVEAALSDRDGPAAFTFFRGFSLLSGLYADAEVERSVVASFVENRARSGEVGADALAREADALLAERFETETFDVSLRRLSDVLAERHVERVNLLKVNVEKAELDVLRGIDERDWERIDQAVVEVDVAANLSLVVALFEGHGFDVRVEQDVLLDRTDLCYVYAVRRGSGRALVAGAGPSVVVPPSSAALVTADALREHVARSLPEYMRPATWTFLDALPLTANGKLDRARLPEPASESAAFVAPRGDLEREVAEIWADALGVERVGAHDNFFDLGGHSLLLARVHARLVERLGVDLSVVELFRHPTVAALAARLARGGEAAPTAAADRDRGARRRSAARGRAGARAARSGRTDANDGEQDE